jgi:hypothetical protein
MKRLRFYKEHPNNWYVDIPGWPGFKASLRMIAGADTLLDHLSKDQNEITINLSEMPFENSSHLKRVKINTGINPLSNFENGADYVFKELNDLPVWLCNVTKYVYGYFPENIYFSIHK